jgi:S-formylglutathione hydrolase FrmB
MGGYGALLIGLRHPELFESAAAISGVLFDEEKAIDLAANRLLHWAIDIDRMLGDGTDAAFLRRNNVYSLVDALEESERPRLFLASGEEEPEAIRRPSSLFHAHLTAKGIAHEWRTYPGSHNWADWAPAIEAAIAFSVREGPTP